MTTLDERIEAARKLTGHTPGPWRQGSTNPDRVSKNGEYIANCDPTHSRQPKCVANARLIAAAPDLHRLVLDLAAEIDRLRADRDQGALERAERDAAWKAGAEAMREAAITSVNATAAPVVGTPYSVGGRVFADAIRALPVPDKEDEAYSPRKPADE